MSRDWLELNRGEEESDCSCSCEGSDSSESCSCEYESLSSSESNSPKYSNNYCEVDKSVLNGLRSAYKSTGADLNIDNFFSNNNNSNFSGENKTNLRFRGQKPGTNLCKKPENYELNLPNIDDLNSKYIQNELKEIHALLSDTNPEPSSTMSYPLRNNSNHYNYQSHGFSSFPSTPNVMSNVKYSNGFGVLNPQNFNLYGWPSAFSTPKFSFKDSDYEDMDKLYNMLVSLDLYSYMYVVENVLDQRLKDELGRINC